MEAQFILIAQNRKKKEGDKTKNTKVNDLKRAARINQRATSFMKIYANLPNYMMAPEEKSTQLLQVLLYLSTDIIKESYQHLGGKMSDFPDLKKRTVAEAIVRKWGKMIYVMGSDACVS